jgi:hypothetical protein
MSAAGAAATTPSLRTALKRQATKEAVPRDAAQGWRGMRITQQPLSIWSSAARFRRSTSASTPSPRPGASRTRC